MSSPTIPMPVVTWAALECKRQRSGEESVSWMCKAWLYARGRRDRLPTLGDVWKLGKLVEPTKNAKGVRTVGVRVGSDIKLPWPEVPRALARLMACTPDRTRPDYDPVAVDDWYRAYEEVHPFIDGNGRTGTLLLNWLKGTLLEPVHPPDWDDPEAYWAKPRADMRTHYASWD